MGCGWKVLSRIWGTACPPGYEAGKAAMVLHFLLYRTKLFIERAHPDLENSPVWLPINGHLTC